MVAPPMFRLTARARTAKLSPICLEDTVRSDQKCSAVKNSDGRSLIWLARPNGMKLKANLVVEDDGEEKTVRVQSSVVVDEDRLTYQNATSARRQTFGCCNSLGHR